MSGTRYDVSWLLREEIADHANLLATIRGVLPDSRSQLHEDIARIVIGTCVVCQDAAVGCQCWNDE